MSLIPLLIKSCGAKNGLSLLLVILFLSNFLFYSLSLKASLFNCHQQIEKYPQGPLKKPALKEYLRGLAVYFWVDRYCRKLAIREKVSVLSVPFVGFFNSVLFFNQRGCNIYSKTAFD